MAGRYRARLVYWLGVIVRLIAIGNVSQDRMFPVSSTRITVRPRIRVMGPGYRAPDQEGIPIVMGISGHDFCAVGHCLQRVQDFLLQRGHPRIQSASGITENSTVSVMCTGRHSEKDRFQSRQLR